MQIAKLYSKSGAALTLGYDFDSTFQELVDNQLADCFILATEYGFSPLGLAGDVIASELDLRTHDIANIANWNRSENEEVSLVGIKKRNSDKKSFLKGSILAASETSISYEQFKNDNRPCRDFIYNVTYEAIYYAAHTLKARKLTISHLSAAGNYHQDMATCTAEALAHFHDEFPGMIDSLLFVGCCINEDHFKGIRELNKEGDITKHRPIQTTSTKKDGFDVVSLSTIIRTQENGRKSFVAL
jgi:hypothetical protein